MLSVKELSVRCHGRCRLLGRAPGLVAVNGVSFDVRRGEVVAVVGGSGSGKTTLGRAVLGLLPMTEGSVRVQGQDLATADRAGRHAARLACQLIFQDPQASLDPRMRVAGIVAEPLRHVPGIDALEKQRLTDEALDQVGLAGFGQRFPHALSGGQRQRVAIARAIIRKPAFVVADEPVSALDTTIRRQVLDLFRSLQERHGFACLFISHDLAAVEQVANRVLVMQDGQVVEQGGCAQVLRRPGHPYTRALLDATPVLSARPAIIA
jgi:peptide/nickel transport system ATP-binding protein